MFDVTAYFSRPTLFFSYHLYIRDAPLKNKKIQIYLYFSTEDILNKYILRPYLHGSKYAITVVANKL